MNKKNILIGLLLFAIGIISRIFFVEKLHSHWDGPQYSIALLRFSFLEQTPAPPGYPLYLALGKIFLYFFGDPHTALIAVSVLFSGLCAVALYLVGNWIFNRKTGIISAVIFLSAPAFYYFGLSVYGYLPIFFFDTLLAGVVYCIAFKKKNYGVLLGFVFGLLVGFRPQEVIYLLPLFLFGFLMLKRREKAWLVLTFITIFTIWFIPFLKISGGIKSFGGSLPSISNNQDLNQTVGILFKGLFLSSGVFLFGLVFYIKRILTPIRSGFIIFFLLWIMPGLLFNLFVRIDHAGYQMSYLGAVLLLSGYGATRIFRKKPLIVTYVIFGVLFNLWWFFRDRDPNLENPYTPTSFHYSEIRKNDIRLQSKIDYIQKHYDQSSTLIVTSPDPWRPLMYYLKPFTIWEIDALVTNNQYLHNVRESKDWSYKASNIKNLSLEIPHGTNVVVVFTDDEANDWIISENFKVIDLAGNSRISVVPIAGNKVLRYGFGRAKLEDL